MGVGVSGNVSLVLVVDSEFFVCVFVCFLNVLELSHVLIVNL